MIINWVPLLACPAVFLSQALLGKPAVAPTAEIPQCWRIHQVAGLFTGNPTLLLRIGIVICFRKRSSFAEISFDLFSVERSVGRLGKFRDKNYVFGFLEPGDSCGDEFD